MRRGRHVAFVVVTVAAGAIGVAATGHASSSPSPKGCSPARTTAVVTRFLSAFNRGDRAALNNAVWGGRLYFNWYAVTTAPGSRVDAESRRRDTLMNYFAARHTAREQLVLTKLELHGVTAGAYRNFEFLLLRSADDQVGSPVAYAGKGASSCTTGRLITWAMGAAG
jgi:hypothetical protein